MVVVVVVKCSDMDREHLKTVRGDYPSVAYAPENTNNAVGDNEKGFGKRVT